MPGPGVATLLGIIQWHTAHLLGQITWQKHYQITTLSGRQERCQKQTTERFQCFKLWKWLLCFGDFETLSSMKSKSFSTSHTGERDPSLTSQSNTQAGATGTQPALPPATVEEVMFLGILKTLMYKKLGLILLAINKDNSLSIQTYCFRKQT